MSMPSLFISHGGPNVVTDPSEARDFLKSLPNQFETPKAIVIVSAHFETNGPVVVRDPEPGMIYDFGGFSPELYKMVFPAKGDPALAVKVYGLLEEAGLEPKFADKRGYDHGTWNTMILAWPKGEIPVVQLSIDPHRDAAYHFALGEALSSLRDEGILLIGSGHITHNLRAVFGAMRGGITLDPAMTAKVDDFINWFKDVLERDDVETLLKWRELAPYVADNHPTDEHLMPLFFARGAAGKHAHAKRIHDSRQYGFFAWDSWLFE